MKLFMEALKGKPTSQIGDITKYLKNDGKVLRFYCQWDDTNLFGEKRPYIMHYFLADDTIEIVEIQQPNSGRDPFPQLLKRQKLAKNATSSHPDVSRIGMQGKDEKMVYFTDKDFKVGGTFKVYTRELMIVGCDKFTQEYYVKTYNANPDDYGPLTIEPEVDEVPKMLPPPHNGIGTEEDSLGSFLYLMPKVPKHDYKKLMENDGIQLRYLARFVDPQVEDKDRRFIITYYLNNDTVSVFEKVERNSGFIGGKFFERARAKNPATGEYFKASDFGVGKVIEFNKHKFQITDIDEYTKNYLSEHFSEEAKRQESERKQNRKPIPVNPYTGIAAGFVSDAANAMYGTVAYNPKVVSPKSRNTAALATAGAAVIASPKGPKSPTGVKPVTTTLGNVLANVAGGAASK